MAHGLLLPSDGFTGTWTLTVNQDYQDGPASMQDLNAQVEVEVIDNPLDGVAHQVKWALVTVASTR